MAVRIKEIQKPTASISTINPTCREQHLCVVSSNSAKDYAKLLQSCLDSDPLTEIVVLALQDHRGGVHDALPETIEHLEGLPHGKRFKLRDQLMLFASDEESTQGDGNFCHSKYMSAKGMAAAAGMSGATYGIIGGPKGAFLGSILGATGGYLVGLLGEKKFKIGCGGVVVAFYSFSKNDVAFHVEEEDSHDVFRSDVTHSTLKGTVALRLGINERRLIVASTHATEGVRGKHRKDEAANAKEFGDMVASEKRRTIDFRKGIEIIQGIGGAEDDIGVVWGGDFNARSVLQTGAPDFGAGTPAEALEQLLAVKDTLGLVPDNTTDPTEYSRFSEELVGTGLSAIDFPDRDPCPTYYKAVQTDEDQFTCISQIHGTQYYNYKKPPSWTDRIFSKSPPWLQVQSALARVPAEKDHDAVYASFKVASKGCDV